jgi:hypothetical protein
MQRLAVWFTAKFWGQKVHQKFSKCGLINVEPEERRTGSGRRTTVIVGRLEWQGRQISGLPETRQLVLRGLGQTTK